MSAFRRSDVVELLGVTSRTSVRSDSTSVNAIALFVVPRSIPRLKRLLMVESLWFHSVKEFVEPGLATISPRLRRLVAAWAPLRFTLLQFYLRRRNCWQPVGF